MIGWLFALLVALTGPPPEGLTEAVSAYRDGRYAEAFTRFEAALDTADRTRGAVLYGMGNCAYRMERYAEAAWHYRRAALRLPAEARIARNLRLAEAQLGMHSSAPASIVGSVGAWIETVPIGAWLVIAVGLQSAGLIALASFGRAAARRVVVVAMLAGGLVAAVRVVQLRWFPSPLEAVVLAREIELRIEPHRDERVMLRLAGGEVVRIAEQSDRWMRVEHPRGGGWTEVGAVGVVD